MENVVGQLLRPKQMLKYITAGHTFMSADNLASLSNIKSAKQTLKEERVQDIFEKDTSDSLFPKEFDEHLKLMKGQRQNLVNHS